MSRTMTTAPPTAPRGERASRIREDRRQTGMRIAVAAVLLAGGSYLGWRWLFTLNGNALWIAIPLILAETFTFVQLALHGMVAWRGKPRGKPPTAPAGRTVDVLVVAGDQPVGVVLRAVEGARAIEYPCTVWVVGDGAREELREPALAAGAGYLSRGPEREDLDQHGQAAALNSAALNSAVLATDGEFVLVLDADQVPAPTILHRTLGYFDDPRVAFVQTRPPAPDVHDPLSGSAPMLGGLIMQGMDGWNAAPFCRAPVVLRRDALMQLAIARYVRDVERNVRRELDRADGVILRALESDPGRDPVLSAALTAIGDALRETRAAVRRGEPLGLATFALQQTVAAVSRDVVALQLHATAMDLASLTEADLESVTASDVNAFDFDAAIAELADGDRSPLAALVEVRQLLKAIDLDLSSEAQPLQPFAAGSLPEDTATAMRLHASGWRSVYHAESLATGRGPHDLGALLTQRLREARGAIRLALQDRPLLQRGLSLGQRLMYSAPTWAALSGFATVVYLAVPVVYLGWGVLPLTADPGDFLVRFLPFVTLTALLYRVPGRGVPTWRDRRYAFALFPVWIRATITGTAAALLRRSGPLSSRTPVRRAVLLLLWPQLTAATALIAAAAAGVVRVLQGDADLVPTAANLLWAGFDLAALSVLVGALRTRPAHPESRGN